MVSENGITSTMSWQAEAIHINITDDGRKSASHGPGHIISGIHRSENCLSTAISCQAKPYLNGINSYV